MSESIEDQPMNEITDYKIFALEYYFMLWRPGICVLYSIFPAISYFHVIHVKVFCFVKNWYSAKLFKASISFYSRFKEAYSVSFEVFDPVIFYGNQIM
jgi:hypothetical protein